MTLDWKISLSPFHVFSLYELTNLWLFHFGMSFLLVHSLDIHF